MNLFFTADLHFEHVNILKYCARPFATVEAMREEMVARWNKTVGPNDQVIVVGDAVMGRRRESLPLMDQLNGSKVLVPGNHDYCHSSNKKAGEWREVYSDYFTIVDEEIHLVFDGIQVKVCHFPYVGDHTDEDRYLECRPTDTGEWLLHGHVHELWHVNAAKRMINVGVDVWDYRPVRADVLRSIIVAKGGGQ